MKQDSKLHIMRQSDRDMVHCAVSSSYVISYYLYLA
jgi:hypothetical protein